MSHFISPLSLTFSQTRRYFSWRSPNVVTLLSLLFFAFLVVTGPVGCDRTSGNNVQIRAAYEEYIEGVMDNDPERVLASTSETTRKTVEEIYNGLLELQEAVKNDYPLGPREEAQALPGLQIVAQSRSLPHFFSLITGLPSVERGSGVQYGAKIKELTLLPEGNRAQVVSVAGDKVVLAQDLSGDWKVAELDQSMDKMVAEVRHNLRLVRKYQQELQERREEIERQMNR